MIIFLFAMAVSAAHIACQPPQPAGPVAAAGANPPPPPPPPPGRGFQLGCSDQYALMDQCDPELLRQFQDNAPPGYQVTIVYPSISPGKNAHRYFVIYQTNHFRRCEDIRRVRHEIDTYKPQNSNMGHITVIPGGYMVEYKQFCLCYRRGYRRRRESELMHFGREVASFVGREATHFFATMPTVDQEENVVRCNDQDSTYGHQKF